MGALADGSCSGGCALRGLVGDGAYYAEVGSDLAGGVGGVLRVYGVALHVEVVGSGDGAEVASVVVAEYDYADFAVGFAGDECGADGGVVGFQGVRYEDDGVLLLFVDCA